MPDALQMQLVFRPKITKKPCQRCGSAQVEITDHGLNLCGPCYRAIDREGRQAIFERVFDEFGGCGLAVDSGS